MGIDELMEKNKGIAYKYANKAYKRYPYLGYDDIYSVCLEALWKACVAFDEDRKYTLSTLAYTVMKNEISHMVIRYFRKKDIEYRECYSLEYIMQNTNTDTEFATSSILSDKTDLEEQYCITSTIVEIMEIVETFDSQNRDIFILYFQQGYTLQEIARMMGTSYQRIGDRIKIMKERIKSSLQVKSCML